MKRSAEVVIVGGECMGCSVAWLLAQRGICSSAKRRWPRAERCKILLEFRAKTA